MPSVRIHSTIADRLRRQARTMLSPTVVATGLVAACGEIQQGELASYQGKLAKSAEFHKGVFRRLGIWVAEPSG